jgi:adenosylmethionine-8-amino-7-oxononanoate aminotransferase
VSDLVILGTDTDAGKTTFALLWMCAFGDRYEYWKPVETGPSDSATIARLVPEAVVHEPRQRFDDPVAPPLAALRKKQSVVAAADLAAARPQTARHLLIESFGSPFSPLTLTQLQLALLPQLAAPCILVSSSALGAIGRTLQCLAGLEAHGIIPKAVVLVGPVDEYAAFAIARHGRLPVHQLRALPTWDAETVRAEANAQRATLDALAADLEIASHPAHAADSAFLQAADAMAVWHPYTPLRTPDSPLPCTGAEGEFLHLMDGRRVIDGISSWWTILHGHRRPELMQALAQAAARIDHVHFAGITHEWAVSFANWLLHTLPWSGGRVFYSDNGSTAVEVALKMAYQFWCHHGEPQRTRFVGFEHGYHGDTFGAMAVSRDPLFFGRFEPLLLRADILPLDPPHLDEHLQRHRGLVAAIIVEPLVQGAGGMHRGRGDDGRRPDRNAVGASGGGDRAGPRVHCQDTCRRSAAAGCNPGRAAPGSGVR